MIEEAFGDVVAKQAAAASREGFTCSRVGRDVVAAITDTEPDRSVLTVPRDLETNKFLDG